MKLKVKLIFVLTILICQIAAAQGLILNQAAYEKLEKWQVKDEFGYSSKTLPTSISYRNNTPMILSQGDLSTCVGWAVSYAHLTTQQNIMMGVTNETQKIFRAMDPNFIYSHIRAWEDKWCEKGTDMFEAMKVLKNYGCKPMIWNPWLQCNSLESLSEFNLSIASKYKIKEFYGLDVDDDDELIHNMKTALSLGLPITIGMSLTNSFGNDLSITGGLWNPTEKDTIVGNHAMCIIGYDDKKFGGSFEVMNSYGLSFGDNGYVWIKYSDLRNYLQEAYVIELNTLKKEACSMGDCLNSYSRYTFSNGDIYEGNIVNAKPQGYGSFIFANGDFYVGGFDKGRKHGDGLYYDVMSQNYFLVHFNYDEIVSVDEVTGYVKCNDMINLKEVATIFQKVLPGKIVDEDDNAFKTLVNKYQVQEKPLETK